MSRAMRYEFLLGVSLLTCSAEDLVVLKAFAGRPRDWGDVETIIARQQARLDWNYIFDRLEPLCQLKGAPEIVDHLRRLQRLAVEQLEQRHKRGYEQNPLREGEFDIWHNEQAWPDSGR